MSPRRAWPVLVVLAASSPSIARAQVQSPPACDDLQARGERLKCKFDRFADEGLVTIRSLQEPPFSDRLSAAQLRGLRTTEERLVRERGRLGGADLELQAKGKKVRCQPRECDPEVFPDACRPVDGDGICDPGEDCLEVVGDGAGDDVQPCWPMSGPGREACAETCGDDAVALDAANFDAVAAAEVESLYDDLARNARAVNEVLPAAAASARVLAAAQVSSVDACALQTALSRHAYAHYHAARMSFSTTRSVADVAERFCDQTWHVPLLGSFNGAWACIAAETVVTGTATWWASVDVIESELDAMTLDATLACTRQVLGTSGEVSDAIDDLAARIAAVEATAETIRSLLETPLGRRAAFPQR